MDQVVFPLRLGRADLERLGVPGGLELDLSRVMIRETEEIQQTLGVSPRALLAGITGANASALRAAVWLALRQAGKPLPLEDVDFAAFPFDQAPDEADDEGKAE